MELASKIQVLHEFLSLSPALRDGVEEMVWIITDPCSSEDEKQMALFSVYSTLTDCR